MRSLLLAALLLAAPACKREHVRHVDTIEEAPRLASLVHMGDRTMAFQLVSGFHDVEANAWRWTMQRFSVNLRPPARAARQGAVLELHLTVPQPTIEKLSSITLSASVGGTALPPETYSKTGEFIYKRDVPAAALGGDSARIDFQLDKAIPPGETDQRELGIVTSSVALIAK
jgi:hypothetical protein